MEWLVLPAFVLLDWMVGDPVYAMHPVRLLGHLVRILENALFRLGWNGRVGGILLVLLLMGLVVVPISWVHYWLWAHQTVLAFLWDLYWTVHLFALHDLIVHVRRISRAVESGDLVQARQATSMLVGRDTAPMDGMACGRAGIESLSENLVDGVVSPLLWYMTFGLPGMLAFKIASTLDSMVGYRTERYLYFGWAGARLDDVMNYLPARLTWLMTALLAAILPRYSGRKTWRVGLDQHALAPGPNSGWSEAAFAGALQCRIAGPIWKNGQLVTTIWLGHAQDPEGANAPTIEKAIQLSVLVTLFFVLAGVVIAFIFTECH